MEDRNINPHTKKTRRPFELVYYEAYKSEKDARKREANLKLRSRAFAQLKKRIEIGKNPFGHSARRIGDFYAGLIGDFTNSNSWKDLRVTPHDHNPVHDAMGNLEAFEKLLKGER